MLPDEQIQRALAYIASLKTPAGQFEDDLIALAADYERQREEIEQLKERVAELEDIRHRSVDAIYEKSVRITALELERDEAVSRGEGRGKTCHR